MRRKVLLYFLSGTLLFAGFVVILVIAEVGLRWFTLAGAEESRDHVMATATTPVTFKPHADGLAWGIPFRTNNLGFRDEPDIEGPPGKGQIRVLSVGDSIGFGLGIPAQDHYTKVAQRLLSDRLASGDQLHVINSGGQGYSPSGYAMFLRQQMARIGPRLVILEIELCNDVTDEALLDTEFGDGPDAMPTLVSGGRYVVGWDGNLLATGAWGPSFLKKTYVYTDLLRRYLNLRLKLQRDQFFLSQPGSTYYTLGFDFPLLTEARIEAGWSRMFQVLEATHHFVEAQGGAFLLMLMPSRFIYQDEAPRHRDFASRLVLRAETMARERQIPFLNMTGTIGAAGGGRLFFDFAHLTSEGNQVVGKRLSREIARLLPLDD